VPIAIGMALMVGHSCARTRVGRRRAERLKQGSPLRRCLPCWSPKAGSPVAPRLGGQRGHDVVHVGDDLGRAAQIMYPSSEPDDGLCGDFLTRAP
jgi:hypothetical protein